MLSQDDKNNIKAFKHLSNRASKVNESLEESSNTLEETIKKTERLLKKYNISHPSHHELGASECYIETGLEQRSAPLDNYDEILEAANSELGYDSEFTFEDILSSNEIQRAYNRVDEINKQFSVKTGLKGYDLAFIAVATALQTLKWICLPEIGNPFDPSERLSHNDRSIEDEHKDTLNDFKDKHYSKTGTPTGEPWQPLKNDTHKKSWIEILYTKAPYDKIKGSAILDLGLSGTNHRLKTLGHDPILGWVFGTANFMTDTATLSDLRSFRIRDAKWQNEPVFLGQLFKEAVDLTLYDKHCLAAALVAQGAHLASDRYTKMGLPVPLLSTLSPDFASKLYSEHYDSLCAARDCKTIAASTIISILINMITSFLHGMFYHPDKDRCTRELYEVRTRKILLLSNCIATSSNLIFCSITKNPKKLDIGGLFVTIGRLFSDIRFITRVKEEFIQSELDKDLGEQLNDLHILYKRIYKEL